MVYSITAFLQSFVQILYLLITVFKVIDASIYRVYFFLILRIKSKDNNLVAGSHFPEFFDSLELTFLYSTDLMSTFQSKAASTALLFFPLSF